MHERTNIRLSAADRSELETVAANRNSPQKHVWRAKIVLLTADGHGTADIIFGYLWAQWRNARGTSLVAPKPRYAFFAKPFLPAPDHRLGLAGGAHDVGSAMTIGRQKQ